jgi:hypothetical protein
MNVQTTLTMGGQDTYAALGVPVDRLVDNLLFEGKGDFAANGAIAVLPNTISPFFVF